MKAVRQQEQFGQLVVEDVPEPQVLDGDVLVRVEAAGVLSYHGDVLSGKLGYATPANPFTPGNDGVGIVEAVGRSVLHAGVGDRVAIDPRLFARENVPEPDGMLLALTGLTPGASRLQDLWRDGTWAEKVAVPAEMVTVLPEGLGQEPGDYARLHKFVVCYGGLVRGRLSGGETVVVLGATGNFGAPAVPLAVAMGASQVVALGRNRAVLEQLEKLSPRVSGLAHTGEVEADAAAIRECVPGGADLGLDLIGHASDSNGIQALLGGLRWGGRLVIQGSMDVPLELPYGDVMVRDIEIRGAFMYPRDAFRKLVGMAQSGALDLNCVDVHTFALDEITAALEQASALRGLGHVVLLPSDPAG